MEILRVPPYPITTTWDVPDANHPYLIYVEDVVDHSVETLSVTSDSNSTVEYILPRSKVQYDRDFALSIYDTDIFGEIVVESNLTVYRPYVDPNMLGTTAEEIADYKKWEIIARSIMDAYLGNDSATGEGFYNHKLIVQGVGEGTDYFPIWHNPKRILKVYENNVLIYNGEDIALSITDHSTTASTTTFTTNVVHNFAVNDNVSLTGFDTTIDGIYVVTAVTDTTFTVGRTLTISTIGKVQRYWATKFIIAQNNSAIMRVESGSYDRLEQMPLVLPRGYGDVGPFGLVSGASVAFPKGFDYVFILDVGYKAVPPDVEQAAIMLIDDLKCGRNEYYKRFVTQYDTDQYSIKYASQFLGGTGNNIVDKILDGYKGNVIKPGIV